MKMTLSSTFWKYALLALNCMLSMLVLAFVSSGVVALGGVGSTAGAYTITIIGTVVLSIAFVGCCASLRESYTLSMVFVGLAIFGIILQISCMIGFLVLRDTFEEMAVDRIDDTWAQEQLQPGAMDKIQIQYSCCGQHSPQDFINDDDDDDDNNDDVDDDIAAVLPHSCCWHGDCSNPKNIHAKGCSNTLLHFFQVQSTSLILISLGTIAVEIMSVASAYYLGKSVEHRVEKMERIVITET